MKSRASFAAVAVALVLAACSGGGGGGWAAAPGDVPASPPTAVADPGVPPEGGIQGSSQWQAGEQRYDEVGYADFTPELDTRPAALSTGVPAGSYVEVTLLDSGRVAVVPVTGPTFNGGALIELSQGALQALGAGPGTRIPVRVRRVTPSPQDQAALAAGRPAAAPIDAPEALLKALRRRLPGGVATVAVPPSVPAGGTARPSRPAPRPPVARPVPGGRFVVQVAALSSAARAEALARSVGGHVESAGGLHRVRLGPYATRAAADSARADLARKGYPDARVFAN